MENRIRKIAVTDITGFCIGQAENAAAGTGCTVLVCPQGMRAGLDVRGGGPAARESQLLSPLAAAQQIHAVVLAGGSAFGLDAAGGVMEALEARGIGFAVGGMRVPLVCQSDLFDLTLGDGRIRPDKAMGRAAAEAALAGGNYRDGCYGAGCGASVGKACGMGRAMKSGIGSFAAALGELQVGAIAAVNAVGDVYDVRTGRKAAGMRGADGTGFSDCTAAVLGCQESTETIPGGPVMNTTLGIVITNAALDKAQLCKAAGMAHDGYARAIRPVHTGMDGDSIYAVSAGSVQADTDTVGILAAEVMSAAILQAVRSARGAYGLPAMCDLPPA